jgi:hypothetical protein
MGQAGNYLAHFAYSAVVVMPPLERGSTIHDASFAAVKRLGADHVRYVPWYPYPRLAVAELEPPKDGKTSWDFSRIDPMTLDFLHATEGHSSILNFSTIPVWVFKTAKSVVVPADSDQLSGRKSGTELLDPTCKDIAGYYVRLVSWYTRPAARAWNGTRMTLPPFAVTVVVAKK